MSGMFPESFKMDNDFHKIETSGARAMTKKIALFVDPSFLENVGSQRVRIEVLFTTAVCSLLYMNITPACRNIPPQAERKSHGRWTRFLILPER